MAKKSTAKRAAGASTDVGRLNGPRLKKIREEREMTQRELGVKADLPVPTLSRIENGFLIVESTTLARICDALDLSADYLLTRSAHKARNPG